MVCCWKSGVLLPFRLTNGSLKPRQTEFQVLAQNLLELLIIFYEKVNVDILAFSLERASF